MNNEGGIDAGLGGRYATALFELAEAEDMVDVVASDLRQIKAALKESAEFRRLTSSPVVSRAAAKAAIAGVAGSLESDVISARFLGVLAENRRLGALPRIIRAFEALVARYKNQVTAEVTTAHPLTEAQYDQLVQKLRQITAKNIEIEPVVDPAILGGLIVRVGSRQIDGSIATKLNMLAHAMKG
ncbi:MAG: F0F1 ATP synthase subunit delta [Sphingomonas fennica]